MDAAAELGRSPASKHHNIQPEYRDEQADLRDGTAEPVSRDQILSGAYEDREMIILTDRALTYYVWSHIVI